VETGHFSCSQIAFGANPCFLNFITISTLLAFSSILPLNVVPKDGLPSPACLSFRLSENSLGLLTFLKLPSLFFQ